MVYQEHLAGVTAHNQYITPVASTALLHLTQNDGADQQLAFAILVCTDQELFPLTVHVVGASLLMKMYA